MLRRCTIALALLGSASAARADPTDAAWPSTGAEARLAEWFASRSLSYPPRSVTLVALKSEGRLELWAEVQSGWTFVRSYLVRGTSGRLGPKLHQGDHQVPEGEYRVRALNPHSLYHFALSLNYPNEFDAARAREDGRVRLGGAIMIHGDRVSDGCLPVGNDAIEELFALTSRVGVENVSVIISPMDLRRSEATTAIARIPGQPPWVADLYAELAHTLREFPLPTEDASAPAKPRAPHQDEAAAGRAPYDATDYALNAKVETSRVAPRRRLVQRWPWGRGELLPGMGSAQPLLRERRRAWLRRSERARSRRRRAAARCGTRRGPLARSLRRWRRARLRPTRAALQRPAFLSGQSGRVQQGERHAAARSRSRLAQL